VTLDRATLAAVEAYAAALRTSVAAFRAYSDAAMARDDARARALDAERSAHVVAVTAVRERLDALLLAESKR
jgi:hypothetical protein